VQGWCIGLLVNVSSMEQHEGVRLALTRGCDIESKLEELQFFLNIPC
jgi:hypothetical protein